MNAHPRRIVVAISAMFLAFVVSMSSAEDDLRTTVGRMAKIGSCYSPSFSPDGETVAFISDLNGVPQVWTVPTRGGFPQLVTSLDDQIGGVAWSPTDDWLAFSLAPGGGMNQQIYLIRPTGTDLRRLTDGEKDNNWLGSWSHDGRFLTLGSSRRDPATVDAWVWNMDSRVLELIAENPGIGTIADLSRDGKRAVIWRMESRSSDNLVLRELESGIEHALTPHEGPGLFAGGLFSPDGSTIYLTSNRDHDRTVFGKIELAADGSPGPIEVLVAREDADVQGVALTHDGDTAFLIWSSSGRSEIEIVNLASGERLPGPDLPAEIVWGGVLSRDDRYAALTVAGAASPTNIWVWDRKEDVIWQLTQSPHAGVDLSSLVQPELVKFPAHDGLELSGWLYRPPGVAEPAPYVLSFHGGPEGQERPSFRRTYQALLSQGIGVLAPNVRGSAGFGKRFVNLDNGALRYDGIKDIQATVDYLVGSGAGDAKRLGIMGGSYGGYMTMAGLAWYPEMFAAGANLFGVVNFETFFAQTEPWMAAISTIEYGDPETQADLLRDLSPIHRVDQVISPTIVLHGANDTNVPVVEAEQVVESLEKRGVPVEYVLFEDEGHGFRKTENRITSDVAIVEWFKKYLVEP